MIYKKSKLKIDRFDIGFIARKYKTPIYCYSLKKIQNNIETFKNHFKKINPLICYAVKANPNVAILKMLAKLGAGAEVVSEGELKRALIAGIHPKK